MSTGTNLPPPDLQLAAWSPSTPAQSEWFLSGTSHLPPQSHPVSAAPAVPPYLSAMVSGQHETSQQLDEAEHQFVFSTSPQATSPPVHAQFQRGTNAPYVAGASEPQSQPQIHPRVYYEPHVVIPTPTGVILRRAHDLPVLYPPWHEAFSDPSSQHYHKASHSRTFDSLPSPHSGFSSNQIPGRQSSFCPHNVTTQLAERVEVSIPRDCHPSLIAPHGERFNKPLDNEEKTPELSQSATSARDIFFGFANDGGRMALLLTIPVPSTLGTQPTSQPSVEAWAHLLYRKSEEVSLLKPNSCQNNASTRFNRS